MNSACVEGNVYFLLPHPPSVTLPTTHHRSLAQLFTPPAAPGPNLTPPPPPCSPWAAVFRRESLCPAVPAAASPPEPAPRALGAGVPRQVALGLRRAGRQRGRGVCESVFHPRERGEAALSLLRLLAAPAGSASVSLRGSHAALPGQPAVGVGPGGLQGAPLLGGGRSEHMHYHSNPSWKENLKRSYYPQGGIYVHTVTPISVSGNYVCKSPNPSAQRWECPCKGLKYAFELSLTVGKLIMLWLLLQIYTY